MDSFSLSRANQVVFSFGRQGFQTQIKEHPAVLRNASQDPA